MPGHTRILAFKARKAEASDEGVGDPAAREVTAAASRAGGLRDEIIKLTSDLATRLEQVLGELTTMADPDKVAGEIESVKAVSAEQVAAAEVEASRARGAERDALAVRIKAHAERREAEAVAQEAVQALDAANDIHDADAHRLETAEADLATAVAKGEGLATELAQMKGARDDEKARADALDATLTRVTGEAGETRTSLIRTQAQLEQVQSQVAEVAARIVAAETAREHALQSRGDAVAEVAGMKAALAAAERQVAELTRERNELTADLRTAIGRASAAETRAAASAERVSELLGEMAEPGITKPASPRPGPLRR